MMPGVAHEPLDIGVVERRDGVHVEVAEGRAEGGPPAQDGDPGQPGLEPLEAQLLEEGAVAVQRNAPLLVVVPAVLGVVADPSAAVQPVVAETQVVSAHAASLSPDSGRSRVTEMSAVGVAGRRCVMPSWASSQAFVGTPSPPR